MQPVLATCLTGWQPRENISLNSMAAPFDLKTVVAYLFFLTTEEVSNETE
jgi:hypothetical protein